MRNHSALRVFRDIVGAILLAVFVIVFVYRPVRVEGTSMMPTLNDEERIFINQFTYRFGISQISRGDTIVFWYPWDHSKSYIKRVIGLPGDTIEIEEGQVYVNGYGAGGGVELPFGGFKSSGHGREKGLEALKEFSATKTVVINHG